MQMVVFITVGGRDEGDRIGRALVDERLAACVNIMGPIASMYRWEGAVECAEEYLLIAKTVKGRLGKLVERVKSLHSYKVPEIIAVRIEGGSEEYLRWVSEGSAERPRG